MTLQLDHFRQPRFLLTLLSIILMCVTLTSFVMTNSQNTPQKLRNKSLRLQKREKPYEFPGGGRTLLPEHRLIALYGTPDNPLLGSLGEQGIDQTIARVKQLATQYQPLTQGKILPTLEIIATIASASPTENEDFSSEQPIEVLKPWVDAAKRQGVYVILDLQPGRSDFLSQAKAFTPLIEEPHVGIALDPEWRLKPGEFHLEQIGSVTVNEVNATSQWLSRLTRQHNLPQKLLLLHQFRLSMIEDREYLDTSHKELAYIIQMDGQGDQPTKQETWRTITKGVPSNVHFGWKNFYDEDIPMLTPEQTMNIAPQPDYISYQ